MTGLNDICSATLRGLRNEVQRRSSSITKSYNALPNLENDYAKLHCEIIAVHHEIEEIIGRKLADLRSNRRTGKKKKP